MQLSLYETLSGLSTCMLAAARAGDWDAVIAAEEGCRAVIGKLRVLGAEPLAPAAGAAKRAILKKLLAEDREIRDLAQPWMRRLEAEMGTAGNARRLDASYGSGA